MADDNLAAAMNDHADSVTRYEQVPGLETHEADDGLVVFDPATDKLHHLNGTAGVLFELCDGSRDVQEMVRVVTELFTLPESPTSQVGEALELLSLQSLIRPIASTS